VSRVTGRARRWGRAVGRFLAAQWAVYQQMYVFPFPWEEDFLRWSGDRLEGELVPPTGHQDTASGGR
jgi:hypothetical protein